MKRIALLAWVATFAVACDDGGGDPAADPTPDTGSPGMLADAGAPRDDATAGGCQPGEELCNGADDDCDGETDEGFTRLGSPCATGVGACAVEDVWVCSADGRFEVCGGEATEPTDELCNAVDDDCDGETDEGFALLGDAENCGRCGNACDAANAENLCERGACRVVGCVEGFVDVNEDDADGCECALAEDGLEVACNGQDDDCDGATDEGFDLGGPCTVGEGACLAEGAIVCDAGALGCDAQAGAAAAEACNGVDDDCDGLTDEGLLDAFDLDGDGALFCPELDCAGCADGGDCPAGCADQDCAPDDPGRGPTVREVCDDGVDQNCDGRDAPCQIATGHIDRLELASKNDPHCRDVTGDGVPDNAFGDPLVLALANPEMARYIQTGSLSMLPVALGLAPPIEDVRFDLGVVLGRLTNAPTVWDLLPESVDDDGQPLMLFPNAIVRDEVLTAGPGDFILGFPIVGQPPLPLRASDTQITAGFALEAGGLRVVDGWLSGVVTQEDFDAALVLLDEAFRDLVRDFIVPDVDLDGDGVPEAYSACISFDASPATVQGFPVEDAPEP